MRVQPTPPLVYLDSQDYSNLSGQPDLLKELVDLKDSGRATFIFSSAVISECAPTTASATRFAVERSHSISRLCGRNTFISIDQILERELLSLRHSPLSRDELISPNGDWFPSVDSLLTDLDRRQGFEEVLVEKSFNRKQRRMVRSKAIRGNSFRTGVADSMLEESQETLLEIVRTYPMDGANAATLLKYIAGTGTKAKAEHALLESLRDVHWMMKWFHEHSDKLSFVPSFIRSPSKNVHDRFLQSVDLSKHISFSKDGWFKIFDEQIKELCLKFNRERGIDLDVSLEKIIEHCPGFVTMFWTLREFIMDSMGQSNRNLKYSDFADAIHSLHAPYVDIFRTDRYMAAKIVLSTGARTTICSRLSDVPALIRQY